jgi:small subunit ribosomal protein S6
LKGYELCLIFHPDASDAVMDESLSTLGVAVTKYSGAVLKTEKWGKRNLKYAIKKHTKGNFCFIFFTGTAETLKEIDRGVRYNEQIMRYTVMKLDKNLNPVELKDLPCAEDESANADISAETDVVAVPTAEA